MKEYTGVARAGNVPVRVHMLAGVVTFPNLEQYNRWLIRIGGHQGVRQPGEPWQRRALPKGTSVI